MTPPPPSLLLLCLSDLLPPAHPADCRQESHALHVGGYRGHGIRYCVFAPLYRQLSWCACLPGPAGCAAQHEALLRPHQGAFNISLQFCFNSDDMAPFVHIAATFDSLNSHLLRCSCPCCLWQPMSSCTHTRTSSYAACCVQRKLPVSLCTLRVRYLCKPAHQGGVGLKFQTHPSNEV